MRCPKCGGEFSESVYRVHVQRCKYVKGIIEEAAERDLSNMKKNELVDIANYRGIDAKWYMKKADIIAALEK